MLKKSYIVLAIVLFLLGLAVFLVPPYIFPHDSELAKHHLEVASSFNPDIITRAHTNQKVAALTFDDGPDPRYTLEILEILEEYQIPATFFVVGEDALLNPEIITAQVYAGHEIENHSFTHPDLLRNTDLTTNEEILWCQEAVQKLTGREPLYFRPPRGLYNPDIVKLASVYGYRLVLWSVCLENRTAPTPEAMAARVVKKCGPGSIILAHDGRTDRSKTVKALPILIESLLQKGYRLVTLEQLLTEYDRPSPKIASWGQSESAGINRHRVGDERALRERSSYTITTPSHARVAARVRVKR
ncbi:MAG: polysaccharide deacetylase family protein [Syntrophomonadales bacterium]